MKYWRGYLVAAIVAAITWCITQLAAKFSTLVDMFYPYLTRTAQNYLAGWSGSVDFCVWQIVAMVLLVLVVVTLVLIIVLRWNFFQWLGWVLTCVSLIYCAHTCLYGLNYHSGSLAQDIRLNETEYTLEELQDATVYYRNLANELSEKVPRDDYGNLNYASFQELAEQAGEGFEVLTREYSYSVFAGSTQPVKELGWADMYTSMGITGVTMGITGEAAVNPQTPDVGLPFTMCHEMAHRMCIAPERDANFAAFLSCMANSSVEFQYSAYFMAYQYCYSALASQGSSEAAAAAARIHTGVGKNLMRDMNSYAQFFSDHKDAQATRLADSANDTYIRLSGDDSGINSYEEVSSLLVYWHIQEVVIPAQQQEAESTFDPYDETQVDLSGIVGALKEIEE